MSSYEPAVIGSFMRRSASASSNLSLATSEEPGTPPHKMESASKLLSRGISAFPAPHKTQLPPRVHYTGHLAGGIWRGACQRNIWTLVAVLAFCSVTLYAFSLSRGPGIQKAVTPGFGIVIDAGSSGSRLHVFKYVFDGKIPRVESDVSKKVTPGLSSFAGEPEGAGPSLIELMEYAQDNIPAKEWQRTRLYLMATAGLRLVEEPIRERILDSCRAILRGSVFFFEDQWASVISGTDEGKFAWVAANYALDKLGNDPRDSVGIVELGGASAQVTFVPDSPPPKEYLEKVDLGGVTYSLYIHSFLGLGQEAAWKELFHLLYSGAVRASSPAAETGRVWDPCTPKGYHRTPEDAAEEASILPTDQLPRSTIVSSGDFAQCRKAALDLLEQGRDSCQYKKCAISSHFIPKLRGNFFGTENFFYTSKFFGLPANATLSQIRNAGEHYCETEWGALQQEHPEVSTKDLLKYCFSTSYIVALLHDSLDIGFQDQSIQFTNHVGQVSLDWALGALIVRIGEAAAGGMLS